MTVIATKLAAASLRRALLLAVTIVAAVPSAAHAQAYTAQEILGAFNDVIWGTFTSSADVEGRSLVNTLDGTNGATMALYSNPHITQTSATLGSDVFGTLNAITINPNVTTINLNAGPAVVVNPYTTTININAPPTTVSSTPAFTMSQFTAPLNALQTQLAGLSASTVTLSAGVLSFNLGSNSSGVAAFNISAADLSAATTISFSGTAGSVVINVSGTTVTEHANFAGLVNISNVNYLESGALAISAVAWNFTDATSITFNQQFEGTVLAGQASVYNPVAPIEGTLYAQNFYGTHELHDYNFVPPTFPVPPPTQQVPEPASLAVFVTALSCLAGMRRRRRKA